MVKESGLLRRTPWFYIAVGIALALAFGGCVTGFVLFGESYWRKIVNFDALVDEGMISAAELGLFEFAETAEQGWASLARRGLRAHGSI